MSILQLLRYFGWIGFHNCVLPHCWTVWSMFDWHDWGPYILCGFLLIEEISSRWSIRCFSSAFLLWHLGFACSWNIRNRARCWLCLQWYVHSVVVIMNMGWLTCTFSVLKHEEHLRYLELLCRNQWLWFFIWVRTLSVWSPSFGSICNLRVDVASQWHPVHFHEFLQLL